MEMQLALKVDSYPKLMIDFHVQLCPVLLKKHMYIKKLDAKF